eukprot:Opistho-2@31360
MDRSVERRVTAPPTEDAASTQGGTSSDKSFKRSQALKYEVRLLESIDKERSPSVESVATCFAILGELLPYFGAFKRLMSMLRDEMQNAVYSREFTSAKTAPLFERIPYFVLVHRLNEERNESALALQREINAIKERLSARERELGQALEENAILQESSERLVATIASLQAELSQQGAALEAASESAEEANEKHRRETARLHDQLYSLMSELRDVRAKTEDMESYRQTYDALQRQDFNDDILQLTSRSNTEPLVVARNDLSEAEKLEEQLLELQNAEITEFESSIERQGLANGSEEAERKMESLQTYFRSNMSALANEIRLLRERRSALRELADELEAEDNSSGKYNFVPREKLSSKYALMIYTSTDNGRNFYALKDAAMCRGCDDRTVICTHKILKEKDVQLPRNCTHIKLCRPDVQPTPPRPVVQALGTPAKGGPLSAVSNPTISAASEYLGDGLVRLWEVYRRRSAPERERPRVLGEKRLVAFVSDFYTYLQWYESQSSVALQVPPTFEEHFYVLLEKRYVVKEIVDIVAYDILKAIEMYCADNKFVGLFALQLCGKMDAVCWKYLNLMHKFVLAFVPDHPKDYIRFARIVYPQLVAEELEQLTLEYVAWSENKISTQAMYEYVQHMMLRGTEPRFKHFVSALQKHDFLSRGWLSADDFGNAIEMMMPQVTEEKWSRYYLAGERNAAHKDQVAVERLAQIGAYFDLLHLEPQLQDPELFTREMDPHGHMHPLDHMDDRGGSPMGMLV